MASVTAPIVEPQRLTGAGDSESEQGLTTRSENSSTDELDSPHKATEASKITAGRLYEEAMNPAPQQWFSLWDCTKRYFLTVLLLYWSLFTSPIAFAVYTLKHNLLWFGTVPGLALTMCLPVMPLGIAIAVAVKRFKLLFSEDWSTAGPGRVFFVKPSNPIASFLWDCYLMQSMYVGQFHLVGTHDDAVQHTWQDVILTKDYWRAALSAVGARLPRELGRWRDGEVEWFHPLGTSDVVVKLPDAYLGIGDAFWTHGVDYSSVEELECRLRAEYAGKEALVLELVRPKKSLGVHSVDVVTLRTPQNEIKVLSALLWTDCTTSSSHSCRAGYTVDVETETVTAPASWYSPFFATQSSELVGTQLKGIRLACEQAVQAHQQVDEKWLTAVGWDVMIMAQDEPVFFEGNFAGARTPRRMFLSPSALWYYILDFAWPFGRGGTARPGAQCF